MGLFIAALYSHVEIIKLLRSASANIDATYTDGAKALHIAAYQGDLNIIKMLIEAGADVSL